MQGKFLVSKQEPNKTVIQSLRKLRKESRFWEFEKLGMREMTIEDKSILLRLIEHMFDVSYKHKNLEQLQLSKMSLEACIDFLQ